MEYGRRLETDDDKAKSTKLKENYLNDEKVGGKQERKHNCFSELSTTHLVGVQAVGILST